MRTEAHRRRRADDCPRRNGSGRDSAAVGHPASREGAVGDPDHARPRGHVVDRRSHFGHVRGTGRRGGFPSRGAAEPQTPVHEGALASATASGVVEGESASCRFPAHRRPPAACPAAARSTRGASSLSRPARRTRHGSPAAETGRSHVLSIRSPRPHEPARAPGRRGDVRAPRPRAHPGRRGCQPRGRARPDCRTGRRKRLWQIDPREGGCRSCAYERRVDHVRGS